MSKLKTANGREIDCSHINPNVPMSQVYLHLHNISVTEAAQVFSDASETAKLTYNDIMVEGYTKLHAIIIEEKRTRIILGKE